MLRQTSVLLLAALAALATAIEPVYNNAAYLAAAPSGDELIIAPEAPVAPVSALPPVYSPSVYQASAYSPPVYQAPLYSPPAYKAPVYIAPVYEAPVYTVPAYSTPKFTTPAYSAPKYPAPVYSAPKYTAPTYKAPAYSAPNYAVPNSYDEPAVYAFNYQVADDYFGAHYNAGEQRNGGSTSGSYSVALPDGRVQTVNYRVADAHSGYVADVQYSGESKYGPHAPAGNVYLG